MCSEIADNIYQVWEESSAKPRLLQVDIKSNSLTNIVINNSNYKTMPKVYLKKFDLTHKS